MKSDKSTGIGTIRKKNGEYTTTQEETLEELLEVLFPTQGAVPNTREDPITWDTSNAVDVEKIVNEQSVKEAIMSFQPYKSPGPDGVYPVMLQKAIEELTPALINIFRQSLQECKPAEAWLETKAVFIPKPGKKDYMDPKSYRPISLSSFVLKSLERIVHWHLLDTNLTRTPFNDNLYSYREGMSTETALHRLISRIEKALGDRETAIVVFLDISGAFSNQRNDKSHDRKKN